MGKRTKENGGGGGMNIEEVKLTAQNKWGSILGGLGVEIREDGKHGPCPICGGKDRFRFDDKEGRGTYICNQCGAGDGWKLVQECFKVGFVEAVEKVAGVVGGIENVPTPYKAGIIEADPRTRLRELWGKTTELNGVDNVSRYLIGRGITEKPDDIRFCAECYEPDSKENMPAMIALVRNKDGKPVTMHRTYLSDDKKAQITSPKKLMPGVEKLCGAAIRLSKCNIVLGVAEGIETALSAWQLTGVPTWALISTTIMESFEPPDGVTQIIVYADNDANYAGQKSAYTLANKLALKGFVVDVEIPDLIGNDWNDVLFRHFNSGGE